MLIPCARHVVVKAASIAAIVNFMVVVAIEESLALSACWFFIYMNLDKNNIAAICDHDDITFLFCQLEERSARDCLGIVDD